MMTIHQRPWAMWHVATPLQRACFFILTAAMLYLLVLLCGLLSDSSDEDAIRVMASLFLAFTLRLLLYLMGALYQRFLVVAFDKFYRQAELVQAEDAFIQALAPRQFELLYKETLPRRGFVGLLKAHDAIRNSVPSRM